MAEARPVLFGLWQFVARFRLSILEHILGDFAVGSHLNEVMQTLIKLGQFFLLLLN